MRSDKKKENMTKTTSTVKEGIIMWQENSDGYICEAILLSPAYREIIIEQGDNVIYIQKESIKAFIKTLRDLSLLEID